MADFCHGCTLELTGEHEYARRNDMVGADGGWQLCECCGFHRFTDAGVRLCSKHPREADVTMEPCELCLSIEQYAP